MKFIGELTATIKFYTALYLFLNTLYRKTHYPANINLV
jgi:hypothetical protein